MKQYGKSWCETFMEDLHTLGVAVTRVSPNEMYKQPVKEEAMKVQRKGGHAQYDVIEESSNFYVAANDFGRDTVALSKKDYEPVEEWVDVTHECIMLLIGETYRVYHACTWIGDPDKYRVSNTTSLSKVKVEVKR